MRTATERNVASAEAYYQAMHNKDLAGVARHLHPDVRLLPLTIQQWVSLRWRSFSVATGTGIVATVIAFFATAPARQAGSWMQYFPWALPMMAVNIKGVYNIPASLAISAALGLVVAGISCLDFCRREVT